MAHHLSADSASVFALSFLGDSVYETWCRAQVLQSTQNPAQASRRVVQLVRCQTQAQLVALWLPHLSPEELSVFRRGKNSRPTSPPRHATVREYRWATGLECVIGWLHLSDQTSRLLCLLELPESQSLLFPAAPASSLSVAS